LTCAGCPCWQGLGGPPLTGGFPRESVW
jgi:hypothetical protein